MQTKKIRILPPVRRYRAFRFLNSFSVIYSRKLTCLTGLTIVRFLSFRAVENSSIVDGPCRSLWVGNINPEEVSERHLLQLFSRCGRVDNVRILPKRFCAFVNYDKAESATLALEKLQVGQYLALLAHDL